MKAPRWLTAARGPFARLDPAVLEVLSAHDAAAIL